MEALHSNDTSLLAMVRIVLHSHCAALFQPDNGNAVLVYASAEEAPFAQKSVIAPGKSLVGWIVRHEDALFVPEGLHPSTIGYYSSKDERVISGFMGCPLPGRRGILCVDRVRPRKYRKHDMKLLIHFAHIAARQADSANQAGDAEELRRYFSHIDQISQLSTPDSSWRIYLTKFLANVAQATNFDYVAFVSCPEGADDYTVEGESSPLLTSGGSVDLPMDVGGLVSWVLRNPYPVHHEGLDDRRPTLYGEIPNVPDFRSMICLPVGVNRSTCGVLCLAGLAPRLLPSNLCAFARMAATQLAGELERLDLRHRLQSAISRTRVRPDTTYLVRGAADPSASSPAPSAFNEDE